MPDLDYDSSAVRQNVRIPYADIESRLYDAYATLLKENGVEPRENRDKSTALAETMFRLGKWYETGSPVDAGALFMLPLKQSEAA